MQNVNLVISCQNGENEHRILGNNKDKDSFSRENYPFYHLGECAELCLSHSLNNYESDRLEHYFLGLSLDVIPKAIELIVIYYPQNQQKCLSHCADFILLL